MKIIAESNTIIGYMDQMAIIKMDNGELGFCVMPEEFAKIGETLIDYKFESIEYLAPFVCDRIKMKFGGEHSE